MGASDWTFMTGSLTTLQVARGTIQGTGALAPPSGGGSNVYAFNSLGTDVGAVAKYVNGAGFIPMAKGGSVSAAIKRKASLTDATPFLFMSAQGTAMTNEGYMLGIAHDEEPGRLVLVKGALQSGLALSSAIANSAAYYQGGDWLHVRLDVIRQPDDNVLINVYENDIDANGVAAPVWTAVTSLLGVADDAAGIAFGAPYLGGYGGVGYYTKNQGRYGLIDQVRVAAQL